MYSTVTYLEGSPVVVSHRTMAHLRQYICFHGLHFSGRSCVQRLAWWLFVMPFPLGSWQVQHPSLCILDTSA